MLFKIGGLFHNFIKKTFAKSPRIIGRIYALLMACSIFLLRFTAKLCSGIDNKLLQP